MKIETAKLEGAALDWAMAKCEGMLNGTSVFGVHWGFSPSTDWLQGGPIIEREAINLELQREGLWVAQIFALPYRRRVTYTGCAGTPLIAAARCYVASKLGAVVEVPDELAP